MQDVRWLFFDLGNTLISEEAATDCRIRQLGNSFEQHGRRYSVEEVRCALQKASAEFAPRLITGAIEKLTDDPELRKLIEAEARYPGFTSRGRGIGYDLRRESCKTRPRDL